MTQIALFRGFALLALLAVATSLRAQTVTLDFQITINPIFISNGTTTAVLSNSTYVDRFAVFKEATQKIYAQAGIKVNWQANETRVDSTYYVVDNLTEYNALIGLYTDPLPHVINMYFVQNYGSSLGGTNAWGLSEQNFVQGSPLSFTALNGVTISESAFANNAIDTIAHEIGHNLALTHNVLPANTVALGISNLMYSGNPGVTTLANIYSPGGTGLQRDQLDSNQLSVLRTLYSVNDTFSPVQPLSPTETYTYTAIPEPATTALVAGAAVLGVVGWRRRRRGSN